MGAMFIGQQFLQNVLGYSTLDAGLAILPAARLHGARRAALGEARRGARRALHAAGRLRLLPARLPRDAAALEGGHRLLEGRARLRPDRDRRRLRGHAGVAFAHRLGAGPARRHGVGHRRPPARPRRGDHAVDPRRRAHRRLRVGGRQPRSPASPDQDKITDEVAGRAARSRSPARPTPRSGTRSTRARSSPRPSRRSCRATSGPTSPGIVAILLGAALVFFLFPKQDEGEELLAQYHAEDIARPDGR